MLKELILSALIATPLGLALVIGLMWLIREACRWLRMRRLVKAWEDEGNADERCSSLRAHNDRTGGRILRSAQNDGEEYWDANWEEAVYR